MERKNNQSLVTSERKPPIPTFRKAGAPISSSTKVSESNKLKKEHRELLREITFSDDYSVNGHNMYENNSLKAINQTFNSRYQVSEDLVINEVPLESQMAADKSTFFVTQGE